MHKYILIGLVGLLALVFLSAERVTRQPSTTTFGPEVCELTDFDQALATASRLEQGRRRDLAIHCLDIATNLQPQSQAAWLNKAHLLARLGRWSQFHQTVEAGLKACDDCNGLREMRAQALSMRGEWQLAKQDWEWLVERRGNDETKRGLAVSRAMLGERDSLQEWIDQQDKVGKPVPTQYRYLANAQVMQKATVVPESRIKFELNRVDQAPGLAPAAEPSIVTSTDGRRTLVAWIDGRVGDDELTKWKLWGALSDNFGTSWREFPLPAPQEGDFEFDPMTAYDPASGQMVAGALTRQGFSVGNPENTIYHYLLAADAASLTGPIASIESTATPIDKALTGFGVATDGAEFGELYLAITNGPGNESAIQSSKDGGASWSQTRSLSVARSSFLQPRVDQATLYVANWSNTDRVAELIRSTDRGQTFDGPFAITAYACEADGAGLGVPGSFRVAYFTHTAVNPVNGDIYSTWIDCTMENVDQTDFRVFFARSSDRGETWTEPQIISGAQTGDQLMAWIEVDSSGRIHLAYYDTRNVPQDDGAEAAIMDVYYASSTDGGESWAELRVTPESFTSADSNWIGQIGFIGDYVGLTVGESDVYLALPYAAADGSGFNQYVARRRLALDVSGLWYDPAQSGHGFSVQHIENNDGEQILAAWFAYDNGEPIWILAQGRLNGSKASLKAYIDRSNSALFPPRFESSQADLVEWGSIEFDFNDEDNARVSWQDNVGNYGISALNLRRLSRITDAATGCLSGTWYDPTASGHGLFVELFDDGGQTTVVATWYAHHNGSQTWVQGVAPLVNRAADLPMLQFAGGARPQDFDPALVNSQLWGQANIRFVGDNSATLNWNPVLAGYPSGSADLIRLTSIRDKGC